MQLGCRIKGIARSAARAPLVHFAALGGVLFALYEVASPKPATAAAERRIVAPNQASEMFVEDEVLYREALQLGLDRDDPMVRRRLVQKMRFLLEDTAPLPAPTDAELEAYLREHRGRYALRPTMDLEHRFFSRAQRGVRAEADATRALPALQRGEAIQSDAFPLGASMKGRSVPQLGRAFGPAFADALRDGAVGEWTGPVRSSYGAHLVRITKRVDGGLPALDRVRSRVRADFVRARRARAVRRAIDVLRARYTVAAER